MINYPLFSFINENKIMVTMILSFVIHMAVLFGFNMHVPGSDLRPTETTINLMDIQENVSVPPKPREVIKKAADDFSKEAQEQTVALPAPPQAQVFLPFYKVDQLPQFSQRVTPVYPEEARKLGRTSQVILEAYIDKEGVVRDVKVLKSGGTEFDKAAVAALQVSLFKPALVMGNVVAVKIRVPYVFSLDIF